MTALVLGMAALLGALGLWSALRLLGRLALDRAERLALAVALLPGALGLAAFLGLLIGWPGPWLPLGTIGVLAILGLLLGRGVTLASIVRAVRTDSTLAAMAVGLALFGAGAVGTTLLMPLSGGALRIGDWLAHWFLVLVYLGQPLPDLRVFTNRVGDFGVISRPPLYNLEGGLLSGALGVEFWPFQLLTPLLGVAVAGVAVLWARALSQPAWDGEHLEDDEPGLRTEDGGHGPRTGRDQVVGRCERERWDEGTRRDGRASWIMAGLVGLSPFLLQNTAYPWSKMVAATFVLLFLYLVRAAAFGERRERTRQKLVLAAACAGFGYLAHQTTLFYVLPTLLWLAWRRPASLFQGPRAQALSMWGVAGLAGLLVVVPWQAWVIGTYGVQATLAANPASLDADTTDSLGGWLLKGGVAAATTLVPWPVVVALAHGEIPSHDGLMRVQTALLTGALGLSGCWLLVRAGRRLVRADRRRPSWLGLVCLCGFLGQVMLQPNWHTTGDAAESMTPIVVLGLAVVAREAGRLGATGRRVFLALILAECVLFGIVWLTWAFGPAWTRDPNAVLAMRYGLAHLRGLWGPAVPLGAGLLLLGIGGSAVVLGRALLGRSAASEEALTSRAGARRSLSSQPALEPADDAGTWAGGTPAHVDE